MRQQAGDNLHHIIEGIFKAFGRAMRMALAEDPRILLPVMVCMDGFIISHTSMEVELAEQELREAREAFERDYLIYQLRKAGGSVGKLSEAVGMERTHLYRKLRSLGIDPRKVASEA